MGSLLKSADYDWFKQRLNTLMFIVLAAFAVLLLRMVYLQLIQGAEYRRLSENNCIRLQSIDPSRGLVFDRNGELLVDNRPSFDLFIILRDAKPVKETLAKLSKYSGIPLEDLKDKIKKGRGVRSYKPVILKKDIGRDLLSVIEVRKFDLPGVVIKSRPRRFYIYKNAAHLIGYLGDVSVKELKLKSYEGVRGGDSVGKFGVEKVFESDLRGSRGGRQVEVNARGQVVKVLNTVDAVPGYNLFLSVDLKLQKKAESLLEGRVGSIAAMDPNTGEVLAMASSPTFNQNDFIGGISHKKWNELIGNPDRPMTNKAVQGEYPPASTYKVITAMAALEEGVIDESTTYFCSGRHRFGDRVFRCWNWKYGGHGYSNVTDALAVSCDVFFYQVAQKLGVDKLAKYAKACGLGDLTGIALDHEADGLIPTSKWKKRRYGVPWMAGETLSIGIGQGYNLSTPLQILSLYAAIGNGGQRYSPRLIKKIRTADGEVIREEPPKVVGKLPISEKNLAIVRKGLWDVVNGKKGTAKVVRIKGIDVSGKTGTAQVFSRKSSDVDSDEEKANHLKPHAWFASYAPSDNPEIAVVVMIEHGESGSRVAGPVAREMIKTYLGETGTYIPAK